MSNPQTVYELRRARLIALGIIEPDVQIVEPDVQIIEPDVQIIEPDVQYVRPPDEVVQAILFDGPVMVYTARKCKYCHVIGHRYTDCNVRKLRFHRMYCNIVDAMYQSDKKNNLYVEMKKIISKIALRDLLLLPDMLHDLITDDVLSVDVYRGCKKELVAKFAAYFAYMDIPEIPEYYREFIRNHQMYDSSIVQFPIFSVNKCNIIKGVVIAQNEFAIAEEDCPICMDKLTKSNASMLGCSHNVCATCVTKCIESQNINKCPLCRAQITKLSVFSKVRCAQIFRKYIVEYV